MRLDFSRIIAAYASNMTDVPHLILKIDTDRAIEIGDFVAAFVGLGSQYEHYFDAQHPAERGAAKFYVREVRAGSIIAELIPYIVPAVPTLGLAMAASNTRTISTTSL